MAKDEDILPETYQYWWSNDSGMLLREFLTKARTMPSMIQNDGTKPWIWVKGSAPSQEDRDVAAAFKEASALLAEVTEKVESIKNDAAIPTRSNKKTGARSKKELREETQAKATEKLKEISVRHGYVSGKWLIFAPTDTVDKIWSDLATSVVSGPLASTCAHLTKVATSPEEENPGYQHVICLYMPNVYDKDAVTEVMRILLRNHGMNLAGVKSNLYTSIGIDSKHPSGIPSTIWKNTALLKDAEIQQLKDAFFAEPKDKATSPEQTPEKQNTPAATSKPKLKPRKKAEDDPFASDGGDDDDGEEEKRRVELQTKQAAMKGKRVKESDEGGRDEEEEEEERPRKKKVGRK